MDQETEIADQLHQNFIHEVVKNHCVWGLTNTKRWATSSSSYFKKTEVMPFWSSEKEAIDCAKEGWKNYTAQSIPLAEFLENWCAGLYEDHLLIGTNWTDDLKGSEREPLDLILEIIHEIQLQKSPLKLAQYDTVEDFEKMIQDMIAEEEN